MVYKYVQKPSYNSNYYESFDSSKKKFIQVKKVTLVI